MSSSVRPIVIDDSDSRIQYRGQGWFQDSGSQDAAGNFGPSYLDTEHGTNSNDSFSFSFRGTSVGVWGTTDLHKLTTNQEATWDPKWDCFVDGVSIGATKPFQYEENNWLLCQGSQLADGPHTLTVNVTTTGNTFWFDRLQFTPSPGISSENETNVVFVNIDDPAIEYGLGWQQLGDTANCTTKLGSQLKFNFTGTSLSWLGFIPTELSHSASSASYSIDGGSPVSFKLNGLPPAATSTVYNQVFFTTPKLSPGAHSLVVTYLGDNSVTPLVLSNMYVTNVTLPSAHQSGSNMSNNSASVSTPNGSLPSSSTPRAVSGSSSSVVPYGAVFGGIFGAVSLIALVFIALPLVRSYKRRKLVAHQQIQDPLPDGYASFTGRPASFTTTAVYPPSFQHPTGSTPFVDRAISHSPHAPWNGR